MSMAKKGFDLAALAQQAMGDAVGVSELDTVQAIPREKIRPNEANFYEMSDLEDLAASIELTGLLHPVLVKPDGEDGYIILDGERRFRALTEVLDRPEVPCIVRTPATPKLEAQTIVEGTASNRTASDILEELMLIEANRQQRKMSDADLSKQAERYTELLAELKKTGVAIPGRLRDAVAEALNVSASKLARMHAIRTKLTPELLAKFDAGKLNESVAYELSKAPQEYQNMIGTRSSLTRYEISSLSEYAKKCLSDHPCRLGGSCDYGEKIFHVGKKKQSWSRCLAHYREFCCGACDKRFKCKDACPKLADTVKKERETEARKAEREKKKQEQRHEKDKKLAEKAWAHLGDLRRAAGVELDDPRLRVFSWNWTGYETRKGLNEWNEVNLPSTALRASDLPKLADLFRCTIDDLFDRKPPVSNSDTAAGIVWHDASTGDMPDMEIPSHIICFGAHGLTVPRGVSYEHAYRVMPENYRWWTALELPQEE